MGEARNRDVAGTQLLTTPGAALMELASSSRRELVLCAPFVKKSVVSQLLTVVDRDVRPILITRWRPDEVAAGVSDTGVLDIVRSRGGKVYLHDRLHAKYYRNEDSVLLGSANLTAMALGWAISPNLELLVGATIGDVHWLEVELLGAGVVATDEIAAEVDELASQLSPERDPIEIDVAYFDHKIWVPSLRLPSDLFTAYSRGSRALTTRSANAAMTDLAALELPVGLRRDQFDRLVGHRLLSHELFRVVDEFVDEPRRFGEVRALIANNLNLDREAADESWQTIMRWMLEFLPTRYARSQARYSEIFVRRVSQQGISR